MCRAEQGNHARNMQNCFEPTVLCRLTPLRLTEHSLCANLSSKGTVGGGLSAEELEPELEFVLVFEAILMMQNRSTRT